MGRAGWAASVCAISPAGLWRAPLGAARRADAAAAAWARRLRPLSAAGARFPPRARRAAAATIAAHPERIPRRRGARLVLGWLDGQRLRRRQPGDAHATSSTPPAPGGRAGDDRLGRARPPGRPAEAASAARPAPASSSSPASATRRPGTTPSWSPGPCSRAARGNLHGTAPRPRRSSDRREDREPAVAVQRLPGRRPRGAARAC